MKQMNVFLFLLLQAGFSVRKKICAKSEGRGAISPPCALAKGDWVVRAEKHSLPALTPSPYVFDDVGFKTRLWI